MITTNSLQSCVCVWVCVCETRGTPRYLRVVRHDLFIPDSTRFSSRAMVCLCTNRPVPTGRTWNPSLDVVTVGRVNLPLPSFTDYYPRETDSVTAILRVRRWRSRREDTSKDEPVIFTSPWVKKTSGRFSPLPGTGDHLEKESSKDSQKRPLF